MSIELNSLYHYFHQKFKEPSDDMLRRKLMAFPEKNLLELVSITLVRVHSQTGLTVLDYHRIDGLTHTNANNTLIAPPRFHAITIARDCEIRGEKLQHPGLPLLAVRRPQSYDAPALEYEYVPLEHVFYRAPKSWAVVAAPHDDEDTSSNDEDSGESADETGLENVVDAGESAATPSTKLRLLMIKNAPAGVGIGSKCSTCHNIHP